MIRIVLMYFVLSLMVFGNFDRLSIRELARLASSDLNKNIIISRKVPNIKIDVNLEDHQGRGALFELFNLVLSSHNLKLQKKGNYYLVVEDDYNNIKGKMHTYRYCFRGVKSTDAELLMEIFENIRFKYLPMNDCIVYRSNKNLNREIKPLLRASDTRLKSRIIKLTIFATNLDKLKSSGFFTDGLELGFENFVDTYFGDARASTVYQVRAVANFKGVLKYLSSNGISEIMQSPTILLTNGIPATFKAVRTIPYLQSTAKVENSRQSTTEEYSYKDVGLQIKITPKIKRNYIFLNLDLISEDIVSLNNNRPITQKIEYKNSVILKKGKAILLTGFKKISKSKSKQKNIFTFLPIVGKYLKPNQNSYQKMQISLFLELL